MSIGTRRGGIDFAKLVDAELMKVRNRGNHRGLASFHEGYAVLAEEVDELWDEVKKKSSKRDKVNMLLECVQIATAARRIAEELDLIEYALDVGAIDKDTGRFSSSGQAQTAPSCLTS